jgi:hypothetical protein
MGGAGGFDREIAADVAGGHFQRAAKAEHDMREVLADAASLRQHFANVRVNVGRGGRVVQVVMHEVHQRQRGVPGVGDAVGGIDGQAPGSGLDIDKAAGTEVLEAIAGHENLLQLSQRRRCGLAGEGRRRMRRNDGAALDVQAGVGVGNFKVVNPIGIKIAVMRKGTAGSVVNMNDSTVWSSLLGGWRRTSLKFSRAGAR